MPVPSQWHYEMLQRGKRIKNIMRWIAWCVEYKIKTIQITYAFTNKNITLIYCDNMYNDSTTSHLYPEHLISFARCARCWTQGEASAAAAAAVAAADAAAVSAWCCNVTKCSKKCLAIWRKTIQFERGLRFQLNMPGCQRWHTWTQHIFSKCINAPCGGKPYTWRL